ncbi:MAG: sigma-54 dependent transcriptional regulator [Gemmatimonadales bacterium]|nr:sigma-54 dependent transcriptional regulator [Gemmatimonadales bacterium]
MATILCVDDEPSVGVVLEHALTKLGHKPMLVGSVDEAMREVHRTPIDLVIADFRMPNLTGVDLIRLLEKEGYRLPVIIMTGYSSIEHAVMSIKSGAIDYLTKPVRPETLEIAVDQALEVVRLRRENESFRREIQKMRVGRALIGESEPFRRVMETITTAAPTRVTVLLEGESGTGKELFARAIHDQSPRADGPFITVNCAAMPEGLIESTLFGHEKGAFTGASQRQPGAFERAHGGTLLLDEISEMRLDLQAKLLRAIQEQEFERVGGTQAIKVDVRLVATTNRDLKGEVDAGKFRADLYYRLNVMPIRSPALRERRDDVPRLVHHFMRKAAEHMGVPLPSISSEAIALLQAYHWPGNVRELGNAIERAVILARGGLIVPETFRGHIPLDLPTTAWAVVATASAESRPATQERAAVAAGPEGASPAVAAVATLPPPSGPGIESFNLDELERQAIGRALQATGGNRTRAAKLLGISERTLRNKLNGPKAAAEE